VALGQRLSRCGWGVSIVKAYDGFCEIGRVGVRLEAFAGISGVLR